MVDFLPSLPFNKWMCVIIIQLIIIFRTQQGTTKISTLLQMNQFILETLGKLLIYTTNKLLIQAKMQKITKTNQWITT